MLGIDLSLFRYLASYLPGFNMSDERNSQYAIVLFNGF